MLVAESKKNRRDPFAIEEGKSARHLKSVIYGNPGCGKTVLAGRLALPDEKIYFIDAESSTDVLIEHPQWFKGRSEVDKFYGWLETGFLLEKIVKDRYGLVVIDSLQSCFRSEMRSIISTRGNRVAPGKAPNQNKDQYELSEYGIYLKRLSDFIGMALRAPISIIINGHTSEPSELELMNGQKRRPTGSDNQVSTITSEVGNVFYMELNKGGPGVMETSSKLSPEPGLMLCRI
jgi:hypothetical protein